MTTYRASKAHLVRPHVRLADRLVRTVEFQSAVRTCQFNQWQGVLEHLSKNKPYYLTEWAMFSARR